MKTMAGWLGSMAILETIQTRRVVEERKSELLLFYVLTTCWDQWLSAVLLPQEKHKEIGPNYDPPSSSRVQRRKEGLPLPVFWSLFSFFFSPGCAPPLPLATP